MKRYKDAPSRPRLVLLLVLAAVAAAASPAEAGKDPQNEVHVNLTDPAAGTHLTWPENVTKRLGFTPGKVTVSETDVWLLANEKAAGAREGAWIVRVRIPKDSGKHAEITWKLRLQANASTLGDLLREFAQPDELIKLAPDVSPPVETKIEVEWEGNELSSLSLSFKWEDENGTLDGIGLTAGTPNARLAAQMEKLRPRDAATASSTLSLPASPTIAAPCGPAHVSKLSIKTTEAQGWRSDFDLERWQIKNRAVLFEFSFKSKLTAGEVATLAADATAWWYGQGLACASDESKTNALWLSCPHAVPEGASPGTP